MIKRFHWKLIISFTLKFLTHKEMKICMEWNGCCWPKYSSLEQTRDGGDHFLLFHKSLSAVTIYAKYVTEVPANFDQRE